MDLYRFDVFARTPILVPIACLLLTQLAVNVRCLSAEGTYSVRLAQVNIGRQQEVPDPSSTSRSEPRRRLLSRPLATPISLKGDPRERKITSLGLLAPDAEGRGEIEFNHTQLQFNEFGDAEPTGEHHSDKVSIRFRKSAVQSKEGRRDLYEIDHPTKLECKLYLAMATTTDEHRLVIETDGEVTNIIELRSVLAKHKEPASQEVDAFDLTSEDRVRTPNGLADFRIEGRLRDQAAARFYLDPNRSRFDLFGENAASTLIGWNPRPVRLVYVRTDSERGRELYEVVNESPRMTQYFLVISPRDKQHRLVVREGKHVRHVLHMRGK